MILSKNLSKIKIKRRGIDEKKAIIVDFEKGPVREREWGEKWLQFDFDNKKRKKWKQYFFPLTLENKTQKKSLFLTWRGVFYRGGIIGRFKTFSFHSNNSCVCFDDTIDDRFTHQWTSIIFLDICVSIFNCFNSRSCFVTKKKYKLLNFSFHLIKYWQWKVYFVGDYG